MRKQKLPTDCASCHRASDVHAGKLGEQCEQCHTTEGWKSSITFDHDLTSFPLVGLHVAVTCEQCHRTRKYRDAGHGCNDCHKSDDVHKGSLGADCAKCHSPNGWRLWEFDHGKQTGFALTGAHGKLACEGCHKQPADQVKLNPSCLSCHEQDDVHLGQYGGSVNAAIPPSPSRALVCSNSHMRRLITTSLVLALLAVMPAFAAQTRDTFDHLTTGFELLGQHRDLPCESCHANAVFKGTPHECGACHGVGTAIRATAKTANHILSTNRCDSCHTPVAWNPAVNFDHAEALGSCSTCHNNVQAQGKGPTHIQTDLECDACHSTISWAGAVFKHDGVTSGCASCHNGVQATGMPASHIPIGTAGCEACHSTTNFTTFAGTAMNHAAVAGMPCAACHEAGMSWFGVSIVTRPPAPHPTSGDCSQCHGSTTSFTTISLRPANHIPTSAPCVQCHTNPNDFSQYSVTGTHIGVTDCLSCHGPAVAGTFANIKITSTGGITFQSAASIAMAPDATTRRTSMREASTSVRPTSPARR